MVDHDALAAHPTRLRLAAIRDQLDSLLDEAAEKGMTLREAAAFLVNRRPRRNPTRGQPVSLAGAPVNRFTA